MGFGASEVFDPVSQVSIPLVGQFFNMVAMFVFVNVSGFQRIFLTGIYRSFQALSIQELADGREFILEQFLMSLSRLFEQALIISLPVLGTLLIVSTTMGLFGKAAPQMNLLMLGFPIAILVAFAVIFVTMPFLMEAFARIIDESFLVLEDILREVGGGI
jgi:flagellar biosynthetic protein FliR